MTDVDTGMILAWKQQKVSINAMAKLLGRNKSSISRFLRMFESTGSTKRRPGGGRKRKTTKLQVERLVRHIKLEIARCNEPTAVEIAFIRRP